MSQSVVPGETPEDRELERKKRELASLRETLAVLEADWATLQVQIGIFDDRYLRMVGARYAELDTVLAEIARLEAEMSPANRDFAEEAREARVRAEESRQAISSLPEEKPRTEPDEDLRALFREVARRVHPDLTNDDEDRHRREALMQAANLAYEQGDRDRLQEMLRDAELEGTMDEGTTVADRLVRVIRQIAQVEERISRLEALLEEAKQGDSYELMTKVADAEAEGRDLLGEMALAVDGRIDEARIRLVELREAGG